MPGEYSHQAFFVEVSMARVSVITTLTKQEREAIRELAQSEGRSMSAWLRSLVRHELETRELLNKRDSQQQAIEQ